MTATDICPDCRRPFATTYREWNAGTHCGIELSHTEYNDTTALEQNCYWIALTRVREDLAVAIARAEKAESLLNAEWGLGCPSCGAEWMTGAALDKLGDLVDPLRAELAAAQRENEAWRALAHRVADFGGCIDCLSYPTSVSLFVDEFEGDGENAGAAAIDLAVKLGVVK